MEEPGIKRRPTPPCSVRTRRFMDVGLQYVCRCVVRPQRGELIGRCSHLLMSCGPWWNFRSTRHIAVSLKTSRRRHPSVNLVCLLIIFFQTQLPPYLVSLFYKLLVVLIDALLGWNLFVAAMTSDGDLRSDLIKNVHNRASYNATAGVLPLNYATSSGLAISGQARWATSQLLCRMVTKVRLIVLVPHKVLCSRH